MLRAFTWLYDTWRSKSKEALEERRRAYSEHFEPAYKRLETVHTNYLTSFHKFYELCRKFETPPLDLLHHFKQYGMEYATWREDLRNFSLMTRELVKAFRKPDERTLLSHFEAQSLIISTSLSLREIFIIGRVGSVISLASSSAMLGRVEALGMATTAPRVPQMPRQPSSSNCALLTKRSCQTNGRQ
jgi:hypothetical protein